MPGSDGHAPFPSEVPDALPPFAEDGARPAPAPMRILLLEDDPADAALITRELDRAGIICTVSHVSSGDGFLKALGDPAPDIILSDFSVPGFHGLTALQRANVLAPGVPFVFVTGSTTEATALEGMRQGAADHVFKDRLFQLGPVVERVRRGITLRGELAEIREQHRRGQRLEAMGEMAGAVAHDFRNILTVILGHGELMMPRLPAGDPLRERLATMLAAGGRGVELCAQLLVFGRRKAEAPVRVDPGAEIRRIEMLFRSVLPVTVEMRLDIGPDAGWVLADPGEFGRVVMNLLVNAREAMPGGGTVTVSVHRRSVPTAEICVASVAPPGEYVEVGVADSGTGMSSAIRARMFEPHFSTKPGNAGTGLGLAIVYGIVRKAGGHLQVESAPGAGTSIRILLPLATDGEPGNAAGTHETGPRPTVVVADDEERVRGQLSQALELAGFVVLTAGDGDAALAAARGHGGPIALLIADLHMPRMDGWDLVVNFSAARPEARIMVMTGSDKPDAASRPPPDYPLIRKPFGATELVARVREILATPHPAG